LSGKKGTSLRELRIPVYCVPTLGWNWYHEGSWMAHTGLRVTDLGFKAKKMKPPLFISFELYTPPVSHPLSEGEMEEIVTTFEETVHGYLMQLKFYESLARNYRYMFSLCLLAYIIGLFSVNTWWFIWFRQPYLALAGLDNWFKRRRAKVLEKGVRFRVVMGKDPRRKRLLDEIYNQFGKFKQLSRSDFAEIVAYLRRKQRTEPLCWELIRVFEDILEMEKEDSFVLQRIAYTFSKKLSRFFLGDLLLIPQLLPPRLLCNIRDLNFDISFLIGEGSAQDQSLQSVQ